jgi:uroporphyrinogen III methyltransferase/synthase
MPAAFVAAASMPGQRVVEGTISNLAEQVADMPPATPGLVIVGPVVELRRKVAWFNQSGCLVGKRILVARARPGTSSIAANLRDMGADVIEAPLVSQQPLPATDFADFEQTLRKLTPNTKLIFACSAGVEALFAHYQNLNLDIRDFPTCDLIALGKGVADKLRSLGLQPWRAADGACDQAVAAVTDYCVWPEAVLITSTRGRPALELALRPYFTRLNTLAIYQYKFSFPRMVAPPPDLIVLPSSSAAQAILTADLGCSLLELPMVAIGPKTAAAAERCGAKHIYQPSHDDVDAVVSMAKDLLMGPTLGV